MVSGIDEIERKIFQELSKINKKIADIYLGAILVLNKNKTSFSGIQDAALNLDPDLGESNNPDVFAQSAHSIRETLNILFRTIDVPEETETLKAKIKKFADPQGGLPDYLQRPHDTLGELHKWFTNVSHHGYFPSETEFLQKLEQFNLTLYRILTHYPVISEIDEILKTQNPTEQQMTELEDRITNYSTYAYVFKNASHEWLPLLKKRNFFQKPPALIKKNNTIRCPSWPESQYLATIADKDPQSVFELIKNCNIPSNKDERNPRVLEDFVKAAIKMPCEYSTQMADLIIRNDWTDNRQFSFLDEELSKLVTRLTDCDNNELALKLLNTLLDVEESVSRRDGIG